MRHIATLVDQSEQALFFHNVIGYDMPVVSGILRTQRRATMSMGCGRYPEIEARLRRGIDHPVAPRRVDTARHKQVIKLGDDVDLFKLPIPMSSIYDGGPMITALSVMDLKHVVVVDDDIDVFNAMDVEWAIATRVQGDRDLVIIPGARARQAAYRRKTVAGPAWPHVHPRLGFCGQAASERLITE
ncbi:MAG: UbiD family decarboxylase [Xanthobacteraceae bacterium]|nr:UbiD family decarboxylase [Xanthobacteraceae bacterium]